MKKHLNKFLGLSVILVAFGMMALISSCEGPAGADGKDALGDGTEACKECHGVEGEVWDIKAQWDLSAHAKGESWERGDRGSCAPCHSGQGFKMNVTGKEVVAPSGPAPLSCIHCHSVHDAYDDTDFAPITVAPVTLGGTFVEGVVAADLGKGNLCLNCHQTRLRSYGLEVGSTEMTTISSPYYGPHYGTQGNILLGMGLFELEGPATYGNSPHATIVKDGCVTCHMYEENHTFEPNIDACQPCHSGLENFDYEGVQTEVKEKMDVLKDLLITAGVLEIDEEGEAHPISSDNEVTMNTAGALFNYLGLASDHSFGVHNTKYVKAILDNSIAALQ